MISHQMERRLPVGRPRKKADTAGQEMVDRLAYLEMENAYLKKLWALVRAERLQGSKEQK